MSQQPIFQAIFGDAWQHLPPVFHDHYANRPFTRDVVVVEGALDIQTSWLFRLLGPLLRLSGSLAPMPGKNVPVTVTFASEPDSDAFCFDREFRFAGRKPYHFRSRMVPVGGNEIIEWMPIGVGWRAAYSYRDGCVTLAHRGYAMRLFGKAVPLPLAWLLGRGYAEEEAIDGRTFRMAMTIRHALFGVVYGYAGTFVTTKVALDQ